MSALPPGTLAVSAGVIALGLSSYGFLALSARALGPERFAVLSVLWVVVYTVGPGLFVPLEQEVGRAVAARRATSTGAREVALTALRVAVVASLAITAAVLLATPLLRDRLLGGSGWLVVVLLAAVWGLSAAHLTRGALAGAGRFGAYGAQLGVEAGVRLAACAALATAAVTDVLPYGLLLGLAVAVGVIVTAPALCGLLRSGRPAPVAELSANLGVLLTASLLSQAVANAGPVVVQLTASDDEGAAGRFLAAFVVARVPLFLFASVQAALLPRLAGLAASGDLPEFGAALRRILVLVGAVGAATVVGSLLLGPEVVAVLFGPAFTVDRQMIALLALGAGLYMVGVVLAQSCIALGRHGSTVAGWAVAAAALVATTLLVPGAVDKAAWGFVAATAAVVATLAAAVARGVAAATARQQADR